MEQGSKNIRNILNLWGEKQLVINYVINWASDLDVVGVTSNVNRHES